MSDNVDSGGRGSSPARRDRPPLLIAFVECPECGTAVAAKWTPDGVEEVSGCAQHN